MPQSELRRPKSADRPVARLLDGVREFRRRHYKAGDETMRVLAEKGQAPEVLVIGCSDSRVSPTLVMGTEPGQVFVVRNIAALVPAYQPDNTCHGTSAAIEYAVEQLQVSHIVVFGHGNCGGIQGLIRIAAGQAAGGEFITPWVRLAENALDNLPYDDTIEGRQEVLERLATDSAPIERASIRQSCRNLLTFPFVRKRVEDGCLDVHGWWLELKTGAMWMLDPVTGTFVDSEVVGADEMDRRQ